MWQFIFYNPNIFLILFGKFIENRIKIWRLNKVIKVNKIK